MKEQSFRVIVSDMFQQRENLLARLKHRSNQLDEIAATLAWALDVLDIYDSMLIENGEPRDVVLSDVYVAAKKMAREELERIGSNALAT